MAEQVRAELAKGTNPFAVAATIDLPQYALADTLDSLRLPSNPRAVVAREDNTGAEVERSQ